MAEDLDIGTQLVLWGYVVLGDVLERGAIISEGKNVEAIVADAWDRNIAWLSMQMVAHGDEDYHMPPEHWCLPAVTELRLIREQAFWDLAQRA